MHRKLCVAVLIKPSVVGIILKGRRTFIFQDKKLFMAIKRAFLVRMYVFEGS
jgi:hypothetical protein